MRVLGFTSASTAGLLLLGTALTTTRTSSAASCRHQEENYTSEREEIITFADATGIAKTANMPVGTGAATSPFISEYDAFAPAGVNLNTGEAQDMPEAFSWLPRLTMDEATRSSSSGIAWTEIDRSVHTFQEVSTGLEVDFHEETRDEDERFRWTRYERDSPPAPDELFDRAFNALLYVFHITNADHIRLLLYGSRYHRRLRRRRNRRINPNSRRSRRLRRVLRFTADVDCLLRNAWSQMIWVAVSPFVEGGPGESAETPQASISPAASVLFPAPTSPVAHWPPMADPNDIFPPVSPLALLTPLETPAAAPWPPLSPFPPTAALDVAIAIPLDPPAAAAPLPPALPVAQLRWASDAAMAVPLDAVDPLDATGPLDAADWSRVTKTLAVKDLHESDRMVAPDGGWGDAIKADVERLVESAAACPSELAAVRWILTEAVRLYPFTGYTQGSEHAALSIYRGMKGDKGAALKVFVQWASPAAWFQRSTINRQPVQLQKGMKHSWKVLRQQSPTAHIWLEDETMDALYSDIFLSAVDSLCTRQGLPGEVVHCLIQKTLGAGENGPAVSLWVMHVLLSIAESECRRKMDATPDLCIRARLVSAGQTITSFEDLARHAPMTLGAFVEGYETAVFGQMRCLWHFVIGLVGWLW